MIRSRGPALALGLALLAAGCIGTGDPIAAPTGSPTDAGSPGATPSRGATPSPPSTATPTARPPDATPTPTAEVPRAACGSARGTLRSFHTRVDPALRDRTSATEFAAVIREVLCDERSWIAAGTVRWRHRPGQGLLINLLPPDGAERRCMELIGLSVNRTYSCAGIDEVVINADRWFTGAPYAWGPVARYREMLINHEVGHILRQRHQICEREGAAAPVMMQQSKTLTSEGRTCVANAWPRPDELRRLRET